MDFHKIANLYSHQIVLAHMHVHATPTHLLIELLGCHVEGFFRSVKPLTCEELHTP